MPFENRYQIGFRYMRMNPIPNIKREWEGSQ
nr:MAG TPA: hypothetical protein [Caudoviricetes sp.]